MTTFLTIASIIIFIAGIIVVNISAKKSKEIRKRIKIEREEIKKIVDSIK